MLRSLEVNQPALCFRKLMVAHDDLSLIRVPTDGLCSGPAQRCVAESFGQLPALGTGSLTLVLRTHVFCDPYASLA